MNFLMGDPRAVLPMTIIALFMIVNQWGSIYYFRALERGSATTSSSTAQNAVTELETSRKTMAKLKSMARQKGANTGALEKPKYSEASMTKDLMYNRYVIGARKTDNILCFGDSLTKGQGINQDDSHPYAAYLATFTKRQVVKSAGRGIIPENIEERSVVESGYSGEDTGSMVNRMPMALKRAHPGLVIILGGTNDLGAAVEIPREKIVDNLRELHYLAHNTSTEKGKDVHTVHLTIPPSKYITQDKEKVRNLKRIAINRDMQAFAKEYNANKERKGNVYVLDMEDIFLPFDAFPGMWLPDGLHFTPRGYKEVANMIEHLMRVSKVDNYGETVRKRGKFGKAGG